MIEKISSRKAEHLDICLNNDVSFKTKKTGFESLHLVHNALPEINFSDVDTEIEFLGKRISFPLMISGITGGFREAEEINAKLAQISQEARIALGVGSQRQILENPLYLRSFSIVREKAPDIPIIGNIGAAQIAKDFDLDQIRRIIDLIEADALAVHLNPLQEVLQPEGDTDFRGVLEGIKRLVKELEVPLIVKETGAGISGEVAQKLADVGVQYIDIAGAGGTSWAGVEYYRSDNKQLAERFWDWGVPTAWCLLEVAKVRGIRIISSGGIRDGIDIAKSIALGADLAGAARPFLQALFSQGEEGLAGMIRAWRQQFRIAMFLTGSQTVGGLKKVRVIDNSGRDVKGEVRG